VALNSPIIIALQPQVFFNTSLYVLSYVLLDLKVHPSANKLYCSTSPHWQISDRFVINSHQCCCICLVFCEKTFCSKRVRFLLDFTLKLNSAMYYICWARISLLLDISPANYWDIYFRKQFIIIPYSSLQPFRYLSDATIHKFQLSSKGKDFKKWNI